MNKKYSLSSNWSKDLHRKKANGDLWSVWYEFNAFARLVLTTPRQTTRNAKRCLIIRPPCACFHSSDFHVYLNHVRVEHCTCIVCGRRMKNGTSSFFLYISCVVKIMRLLLARTDKFIYRYLYKHINMVLENGIGNMTTVIVQVNNIKLV